MPEADDTFKAVLRKTGFTVNFDALVNRYRTCFDVEMDN